MKTISNRQSSANHIAAGSRSLKPAVILAALLFGIGTVSSPARICNLRYSHSVPSAITNGGQLEITFDYVTETPGGERIFIRPTTGGALSPGYGASGSLLYNGTGTDTAWFTILNEDVKVDGLRIEITDDNQTQVIHSAIVPVEFYFGSVGVNDVSSPDGFLEALRFNDVINLNFNYQINVAGGARIFIRPFSGGALSPDYMASGSPLYVGSGNGVADFTIAGTAATKVDQLRVQVLNADQSQLLREFFVPVEYHFGTTRISRVVQTPSPAHITNPVDLVSFSFNYATTEPLGVRIFLRPFVNGALMQDYGASGSPLYTGTGTDNGSFEKIQFTLPQVVDQVRVQVFNNDQSTLFLEYFIPLSTADVSFGTNYLSNLRLYPGPKAILANGENVFIDFDYNVNQGGGVLIFARPYTAGQLTPFYAAHPSPVYPSGSGTGSGFFTIQQGPATVDQIRFQIWDPSQTKLLMEFFVPVHYIFGSRQGPTLAIRRTSQTLAITWPSVLGQSYQLQWCLTLPAPAWNNLGDPLIGTGSTLSILDNTSRTSAKFYQLLESQ